MAIRKAPKGKRSVYLETRVGLFRGRTVGAIHVTTPLLQKSGFHLRIKPTQAGFKQLDRILKSQGR